MNLFALTKNKTRCVIENLLNKNEDYYKDQYIMQIIFTIKIFLIQLIDKLKILFNEISL